MPLLTADDPLPECPRRVLVAGVAGAGKSTLARRVAGAIGAPHIEIDGLFHGPNWTERAEFVADVDRFSSRNMWVTEWQYSAVRALLLDRCDLILWLDLPTLVVMGQVTRRTVRRRLRGEVLWNGNLEPPLHTFLTEGEHIVRWAWTTRRLPARRVRAALWSRPDLPVVRLKSHAQTERWLEKVLADAP